MGTNYYWHESAACEHCGRDYEPKHIGKRSAGWRFALHIDGDCESLSEWAERFDTPGSWIVDEYGQRVGAAEMTLIIAEASSRDGKFLEHSHAVSHHTHLPVDHIEGEFS